jgi:hypothetical protein
MISTETRKWHIMHTYQMEEKNEVLKCERKIVESPMHVCEISSIRVARTNNISKSSLDIFFSNANCTSLY